MTGKQRFDSGVPKIYLIVNKSTDIHWYPLRVTYSRELLLKEFLDSDGVENFIPMRYEYVKKGDRKIRKLVPVVHNLVFVHTSLERIECIKQSPGFSLVVRYIIDRETHQPLIIPEVQMRSFIAVSGSYEEQIVYLDPEITALQKGDRVHITGGIFEGVEGIILRVKGDRRIAVCIQGVMAVATAYVHPSLIEKIED
nr:UpxY family transcription antiterminator [Jilunia laotingensis]